MALKKSTRGRPKGHTYQGEVMRERLYKIALESFEKQGYEATTLRDIAAEAEVTAGLVYKYFPSKQAIVLRLYEELSAKYARQAAEGMPAGVWRIRFIHALEQSISTLKPHRAALKNLTPLLVGDEKQSIFSAETAFSRSRVEQVFIMAVNEAKDAPPSEDAKALGRVLYVIHLVVILWWLLDKSPRQKATEALLSMLKKVLGPVSISLKVSSFRKVVKNLEALCSSALFGE